MQPKQFNMLAIAAVISLIAAGVVHSAYNSFNEDTVSGKRLFPALEAQGDATGQIAIQQGEKKLTLKKSSDGKVWSLVERAGYPVDPMKVRELVVKLGQTELIEKKTSNKELYGQLDLDDPKAKDSSAKTVRLGDKDNKTIAELIVGKERRGAFGAGKAGTYVRMAGNDQTWLAKLELNASTDPMDWVKAAFFAFDDQKMKSLIVKDGDKVIYTVGRAEKKKDEKVAGYKLLEMPTGAKIKKALRLDDLVKGISTLEMINVRAASVTDAKPDMTAEITMDDGAKYLVGMKREDKKRWLTVAVSADGKDAAAAKKIRDATNGWAYEIADWRAKQTFRESKDIFEEVKAEAPKAPKMSVPPKAKVPLGPRIQPETTEKKPEPADAAVPKK